MTGKIRIISGRWRGRRLKVPDLPGLRPSGDRVRETLFNWLQWNMAGARCLDLFAGTGALGLEALSRGAAKVTFVERSKKLVAALHELAAGWPGGEGMEVVQGDVAGWLEGQASRNRETPFDLVFIDPPFSSGLEERALELLLQNVPLSADVRIYVEQAASVCPPAAAGKLQVLRSKTVGDVRMSLFTLAENPPDRQPDSAAL